MSSFRLVYGRDMTAMLDAMLPHVDDIDQNADLHTFLHLAEEARQLARVSILDQQCRDAQHYNLRRCEARYTLGDRVWVWFPIRLRGLSEKLFCRYFGPYKVIRPIGDLNYEVVRDGFQKSWRSLQPEVVHVVRLKPYYER
ncbi:hypothetical protein V5799_013734 [Amblyomma americanum]|uniref:Tf2-1-like SH3-like domain-containing protein n=1 Tax=Amblyomma americanum TaxID=6943 RepID=A0AAQ4E524_AMBAM